MKRKERYICTMSFMKAGGIELMVTKVFARGEDNPVYVDKTDLKGMEDISAWLMLDVLEQVGKYTDTRMVCLMNNQGGQYTWLMEGIDGV